MHQCGASLVVRAVSVGGGSVVVLGLTEGDGCEGGFCWW